MKCVEIYEAVRDEKSLKRGNVHEVAEFLGVKQKTVYQAYLQGTRCKGCEIMKVGETE